MRHQRITKNSLVSISLLLFESIISEFVGSTRHSTTATLTTYFALLAVLVTLSFQWHGGKISPKFLKLKHVDDPYRSSRYPWVHRMFRIVVAVSAIRTISESSRRSFLATAIMSGIALLLVGILEVLDDWNQWTSSRTS